jgi:hypothetical protein
MSSTSLGQLDLRRAKRAVLSLKESDTGRDGSIRIKGRVPNTRPIPLQFNPKEYQISGSASWRTAGSKDGSVGQYQGTGPYTLSLEVFIDEPTRPVLNPSSPSLADQVDWILASVQRGKGDQALPPVLEFAWGPRTIQAIATQVSAKFIMFDETGAPIRATCQLQLTVLPDGWPRQNPTSGTPKIDRSHLVVMGDTLASIANQK